VFSDTQTLAEVIRGPIDLDRLPRTTPTAIRQLLRRCLDRNLSNRLRDIGEARIAIDGAFQPDEATSPAGKARSLITWIGAMSVLALALAALAFIHFRPSPSERQHFSFQISPPEGQLVSFRLSPDGKFLAMVTSEESRSKIWIRSLDRPDAQLLTDMRESFDVAWSQDGKYIGFLSGDKLYKIARSGGPPVFLADAPSAPSGGVWLDGGIILLTSLDARSRPYKSQGI